MQKLESTQRNVQFSFCQSPVTIDKSDEWGPNNLQVFPNGVFLKHTDSVNISHGVQPNEKGNAPIGWMPNGQGTFNKLPIWVMQSFEAGDSVEIDTRDGVMNISYDEPFVQVCNSDVDGNPDLTDSWAQKLSDLEKNYVVPATVA